MSTDLVQNRWKNPALPPILLLALLLTLLPAAPSSAADPVEFQMAELIRGYEGCVPVAGAADSTYISYRFPAIMAGPSEEVEEAIRSEIREFLYHRGDYTGEDFYEVKGRFFRDYGIFRNQFPDSSQVWMLEKEVGIIHMTPRVLTLAKRSVTYLGGAHPVPLSYFVSLDLETGRPIRLQDLILPGAFPRLTASAEERFRQAKGLGPDDSLAEDFFFADDRFRLNDNMGLLAEGLLFYFNVYEIQPYAAGPTRLLVPVEELKGLVRPDGPLGHLGE